MEPTVITALSKREEEIARFVASGLSNDEVAQRLSLRRDAVEDYLSRVYEKLGISTRIELVLYILSRYQGTESEPAPKAFQRAARRWHVA
jgi:DNA-binding NarL/FixJ family response regulator